MKARITSELARADLTIQISNAINDAILICQIYRFRFSETVINQPSNFLTAVGTNTYAIPFPGFFAIDYMEIAVGAAPTPGFQHVARKQPEMVRLKAQGSGVPTMFAIEGEKIMLGFTPNAIYPVLVHGHILVAAPASDIETGNRWMTDGERMIRALAKREIARDVTRNPTMQEAMNKAFVAEAVQLISEMGRLDLFQGLMIKQENVKVPEDVIQ